ncbi:serine/threonine-protein kinase [Alienimonas californiensis]|uniref:Protein kinase domain-containing protein n=1 Tax=Alienimonas californiensis TaxID=2527989 RepID=A0A517PD04_9PLAN|nr:hypothetical protein [Alienimonas californiensis]QDT17246.1 hypothetical protein CA12_33600 [Alienimonas californiensis]
MPAPPPELAARLAALDRRLVERARRLGGAVRRLSEVPAGDLLWLDRLHAAGALTDYQVAALIEGRDAELRVGEFVVAGSLGARTRTAVGAAGPAVLKRCGVRTEALDHLGRVAVPHAAIVVPHAVTGGAGEGQWVWTLSAPAAGGTLAARLSARGRFTGEEALALARTLAGGLAAAEAAGLIHGEIHAKNVRLGPAGPVLVDCGLAPLLPPRTAGDGAGDVSRGGWAEPTDGPPTFGTDEDLRAFAALLWGALTGRPPFLLAPRRFGTVGLGGPPLPPVGDLAPDAPAPLVDLIDRLLGHLSADARWDGPPASFAEVVERLRPVRPAFSPVRTAGWATACGFALAGIVGAASVPDPAASPSGPADAPAPIVTTEPAESTAPPSPEIDAVPPVRRVAVP